MSKLTTWSIVCDGSNWSIWRDGWSQPVSPTTRAGTPATVLLCGTGAKHHRAGRDLGAMADLDVAEDFRAGADQHAVADLRMAVAAGLAGAAERHAVQDRDVVFDDGRLADHQTGRMVDEDALADLAAGLMSVWNTEDERLCR